ncbi:amino acid adenylation domain-containing protein [Streptacidiphilus sp. P02-A3a]|uniref:amino acid adenylation domain-containing protein n=1 Tax=Streptacidiphilus sp. P02-A3a TaxID=2704468 RepID=UPI0015F9C09B|nr:amino acid adenylation domain-containing protein [Streptacidiphilus sp. P02-A3a]QMU71819.1 amino acid adenylation domain-containing protein [Streptacidiphilus sp. P02-A3a]
MNGLLKSDQRPAWTRLEISPEDVKLAVEWSLVGHPQLELSQTVTGAVVQHAQSHPDGLAIIDGSSSLTYSDLVVRVAEIRLQLTSNGCASGDLVAVILPRSPDIIALFLALESLGAVYLPLSADWPEARIVEVLHSSRPALLVLQAGAGHLALEGLAEYPAITLSQEGAVIRNLQVDTVSACVLCDDVAEARYLIYTSGTTGVPKGAIIEHRGMMNHLLSKVMDLGLTSADIIAFSAPVVFDISIWQMMAPLLVGGTVAVIDDSEVRYPRRLLRALNRYGVTVAEFVPTVLSWLAETADKEGAPKELRWLISTGEELQPSLARHVLTSMPGIPLLNAYGPTECSDDVTHHQVTLAEVEHPRISVGRPIINTSLYVLVQDGDRWRAAGADVAGELFVGGISVGPGYLNDPNATSSAFYQDELDPNSPTGRLYRTGDAAVVRDGLVYCLGRLDRQVKISGVRMELSEIEAVLGSHPAIRQCAVVVDKSSSDPGMVAYYIPKDASVASGELMGWLRDSLPRGMVPQSYVQVGELPLTPNGKVDHSALTQKASNGAEASAE